MRASPAGTSQILTADLLTVARPLALEAAQTLRDLRQKPLIQERKADRSWVTNADHAADAIITAGLRRSFPDHAILSEESGLLGSATADYLWVVDPLDGTKAYIQNRPGYSVMIGLLHKGQPLAGVVADPVTGHLFQAGRGEGAWLWHPTGAQRLQVSKRQDRASWPVVTSTGFPADLQAKLRPRLSGPWLEPVNSVGIKVGLLVLGQADIYINHHHVHYWDTCAPQIILEEAGGRISLGNGAPLDYRLDRGYRHTAWTLATQADNHHDILREVAAVMTSL